MHLDQLGSCCCGGGSWGGAVGLDLAMFLLFEKARVEVGSDSSQFFPEKLTKELVLGRVHRLVCELSAGVWQFWHQTGGQEVES